MCPVNPTLKSALTPISPVHILCKYTQTVIAHLWLLGKGDYVDSHGAPKKPSGEISGLAKEWVLGQIHFSSHY